MVHHRRRRAASHRRAVHRLRDGRVPAARGRLSQPRLRLRLARTHAALAARSRVVVHREPLRAAGAVRGGRTVRAVRTGGGRARRRGHRGARPGREGRPCRRPEGRHGHAARARHALPRRRSRVRRLRLGAGVSATGDRDVAILGVGMHPWGKWGRDFTEYGMVAARGALDDAGVSWRDVQYVAGADTIRNGYPAFIAGATFAQKLGWTGVRVSSSYAACASGAQALHQARAQILAGFCDVALVIGADTTPKGFFAPVGGERKNDPDWLRFHLLGATNPVYFALYARRRMDVYGATSDDFARVKVKNSKHGLENPNARFRKENAVDDVLNSPIVADPLRLLDICATSDGAAAMIVSSMDFARSHLGAVDGVPRVTAVSTVTPS